METLESLKKRIKTTEDLKSVVKTMKALAAVNIRQYEEAVASLSEYHRTIDLGLQVVLRRGGEHAVIARVAPKKRLGIAVLGSDQGMCGQLNEQIVAHAIETMKTMKVPPERRTLVAVGMRAAAGLEDAGFRVSETLPVPSSTSAITKMVQEVLVGMDAWQAPSGIDQVMLVYHQFLSGSSFRPHSLKLLPIDQNWLQDLKQKPWPSRCLPTFSMAAKPLFSSLIRQYFFVSLYRAFAESLASENASRLASMQGAERNIGERLDVLQADFHRQRQMTITEELLDIVAGFEALNGQAFQ